MLKLDRVACNPALKKLTPDFCIQGGPILHPQAFVETAGIPGPANLE
jgi:hypothetical protein